MRVFVSTTGAARHERFPSAETSTRSTRPRPDQAIPPNLLIAAVAEPLAARRDW